MLFLILILKIFDKKKNVKTIETNNRTIEQFRTIQKRTFLQTYIDWYITGTKVVEPSAIVSYMYN